MSMCEKFYAVDAALSSGRKAGLPDYKRASKLTFLQFHQFLPLPIQLLQFLLLLLILLMEFLQFRRICRNLAVRKRLLQLLDAPLRLLNAVFGPFPVIFQLPLPCLLDRKSVV